MGFFELLRVLYTIRTSSAPAYGHGCEVERRRGYSKDMRKVAVRIVGFLTLLSSVSNLLELATASTQIVPTLTLVVVQRDTAKRTEAHSRLLV